MIGLTVNGIRAEAAEGETLLKVFRRLGFKADSPCGGNGKCGKCEAIVNGERALACRTEAAEGMTVFLQERESRAFSAVERKLKINPPSPGQILAFDIGTTSLAAALYNGETGELLAEGGAGNPQQAFGADVVSRIRAGNSGNLQLMRSCLLAAMEELIESLCGRAGIESGEIGSFCAVGNSCMQQIFMGRELSNLSKIPFDAVYKRSELLPAAEFLPLLKNAVYTLVPDISGFVGGDALACALACGLPERRGNTLLVDIGTNAEIILKAGEKIYACSAAAGPALEGAEISCGMRAEEGAIDSCRITPEGEISCHVIGEGRAEGICGSGITAAVACALQLGLINRRGRTEAGIPLKDGLILTQNDVRAFQLAKGAVAAGIELLCERAGIDSSEPDCVLLAGAFGNYVNPSSAIRTGLLPNISADRIVPAGNGALRGAALIASDRECAAQCDEIIKKTEFVELAALEKFSRVFADNCYFREEA